MTQRIIAIVFALMLVFSVALLPASAAGAYSVKVDDAADLIFPDNEAKLTARLNTLSRENECNVLLLTANDLSGATFSFNGTGADYAQRYYETAFGKNVDGVIIFLTLSDEDGDRQLYLFGTGKMEKRLTDGESENIREKAVKHKPKNGSDYSELFNSVVDGLEKALPPHVSFAKTMIAIGIGFVLSLIIMLILKSKLTSVKPERGAVNYIRPGSMDVTESRDTYLYRTVSRTARPKNNSSSHTSSGGGSYSGGGTKF